MKSLINVTGQSHFLCLHETFLNVNILHPGQIKMFGTIPSLSNEEIFLFVEFIIKLASKLRNYIIHNCIVIIYTV